MKFNFLYFQKRTECGCDIKPQGLRQDMPPPGGYKPINYKRVPAAALFKNGSTLFGGYILITATGLYLYYLNCRKLKHEAVEMRSAKNVIFPILVAERDREYLKQLSRNREEEKKLMKNVKGWEVGTWYGEPVFKTIPPDALVDPMFKEYYAHAPYSALAARAHIRLMT